MNFPWAICIDREDVEALASLRLVRGIEVGEDGPVIWLRGKQGDQQLASRLLRVPSRQRYEWLIPNQLRQLDRRIPLERLPDLRWQSLDAWLQVEMPAVALPGNQPAAISLRLVRSTLEREPELLLTVIEEFIRFGATAAQVRLNRLQFAANIDGQVLVRGLPLPPLPGHRFVLHAGSVAVPAGLSWQPAVGVDLLMRCFQVSGGALVVWNEDGTITRFHSEQFVPASRSAIRATGQTLATTQ